MHKELDKLKAIQKRRKVLGDMHRLGYKRDCNELAAVLLQDGSGNAKVGVSADSAAGKVMRSLMLNERTSVSKVNMNSLKSPTSVGTDASSKEQGFKELLANFLDDRALDAEVMSSKMMLTSKSPRSPQQIQGKVIDPDSSRNPELARAKIAFIQSLNLAKLSDFMQTHETVK